MLKKENNYIIEQDHFLRSIEATISFDFIPLFVGSKTPTSKFGACEEVRWEITAHKSPIGVGS
ncbi:hypothetical protein COD67_17140 [Bacillus cereus]|nr:hypothetical protein COD67_17140 [Bacillus cereus]